MENNSHYIEERIAVQKTFIMNVYNWMSLALLITGGTAFLTASSNAMLNLIFSNNLVFFGLIGLEFIMVIKLSRSINTMSPAAARFGFLSYAALNGVTLSAIFLVYAESTITTAFLVTAGTFAVMSAYGFFTKKDLTSFGSLAFMAIVGIIIGSIVNFFFQSTMLYYIITYVSIFVFTGLIAYDTQKIKMYCPVDLSDTDAEVRGSIIGALSLYLDFINLFLSILRLFRNR